MDVVRGIGVFFGLLLLLVGLGKLAWSYHEWDVMVREKERPPLYPNGPRVNFWVEVILAAIGGTMLLLAVLR